MSAKSSLSPFLLAALLGCLPPEDDPTQVKDLRVLGVSLEPPELLAPACSEDPSVLALYAAPIRYTALIADPNGGGRELRYALYACTSTSDRTCGNAYERVLLAEGTTTAGELTVQIRPGAASLSGAFLLESVLAKDPYHGLGGGRMPLVLHLEAADEEIYAQKLMVFSCKFFPEMRQNVNPLLPDVLLRGESWAEGLSLSGSDAFRVTLPQLGELQEAYVVPSFELTPVNLVESWKISWHADFGRFSQRQTGGTNFLSGEESRHEAEWIPEPGAGERDVTFWLVVRDGRGGQSWWVRRGRWTP